MNKIFIIAEAGVNHNGSIKLAKKMIDAAVKSGADAVKFQTFKTENLVSKFALKADYQKKETYPGETQSDMLRKLELNAKSHHLLMSYCHKSGIMFLSSPFDLESIDLLDKLGLKIFKIGSGEITNLPYLRKIGRLQKQIILSTGMSTLSEIGTALDILVKSGTPKKNITLLHCTSEYPTSFKNVNLRAMLTFKTAFNIDVGYSDHTLGIETAIAAAALGATVIEKHFTLDKNLPGPDHKASIEPHEFKQMVEAIRNIENAMGSSIKKPTKVELSNRLAVRKSIVALHEIKKGDIFTEKNITTKRPGTGISPMKWDSIIGKIAKKDFHEDDLIEI